VYAIIEDSGQQFKVQKGDVIDVDIRNLEEGQQQLEFDRVLMIGEGADAKVGTPLVEGAKVVGKLEGQVPGEKLHIIKFKRRKTYRRKTGHRQKYLRVTIDEILS
jgi:large subunit ribosomal protein L21